MCPTLEHYEMHAEDLLKEVKGLKLSDQQQQRRRYSNSNNSKSEHSNSPWEVSHESQLYPGNISNTATTQLNNGVLVQADVHHSHHKREIEANQLDLSQ